MKTAGWAVSVLLGGLLWGSATRASPAIETRFFDELARRAYQRGDYETALRGFLLSNDVTPSVGTLYNIGVCAELVDDQALAYAAYQDYTRGEDRDEARRQDAEARLEQLKAQLAVIHVTTDPPGATIYVDRSELGEYGETPRSVVAAPGKHVIEVALPGYHEQRVAIEAVVGAVRETNVRLEPLLGSLKVTVTPPAAQAVLRRGQRQVARVHSGEAKLLPVGHYQLEVSSKGFESTAVPVLVEEGKEILIDLVAQPLPVATGILLVDTGTAVARVLVDGKPAGQTPATFRALPVGEHRVELQAVSYHSWKGTIHINAEQSTFVSVTLVRREQ